MKLQQLRQNNGLSQKQLSDESKIPLRTIQQWECGQRNIDGASINRLCDLAIALNCKIYDLIDDEELIQKIKKTL